MPYWGKGEIHLEGMKRIIEVQRSVGAIKGEIDLSKIIDTQFLPDDLKKIEIGGSSRRIVHCRGHRSRCAG